MKKSMIALAVLAAAAGTAQAASSVTLYGRADVGYTRTTVKEAKDTTGVVQGAAGTTEGQNRLGIKGQEDLGNGYAAIFQMEGRFDGSTGSKTTNSSGTALAFFDRESTVGLKTPYGSLRLGRSLASMERALGFANIGNRSLDLSPYSSAARQSNAAFYDANFGAVSFGGHVTTRGTSTAPTVNSSLALSSTFTEGSTVTEKGKAAYGAYAKYSANGLTASAGYQKDGANANHTKEWGVGLGYTMNPVFVNVTYASLKPSDSDEKLNTLYANLGAKVTPNDTVAAIFKSAKLKFAGTTDKADTIGLTYAHAMSKRTSVYANVGRLSTKEATATAVKSTTWDVAVRHNF